MMTRVWVLLAGLLAAAAVRGIPLLGHKHCDSQQEVGEQGFALLRGATTDTHTLHAQCAQVQTDGSRAPVRSDGALCESSQCICTRRHRG